MNRHHFLPCGWLVTDQRRLVLFAKRYPIVDSGLLNQRQYFLQLLLPLIVAQHPLENWLKTNLVGMIFRR